MTALGQAADRPIRAYLTGGASAVLEGWRATTIDVDLTFEPETDAVLRALPELKEKLELNVELVSPAHFVPEVPGWQSRSVFVGNRGSVSFHHYDFYAQALSKLERGHPQDMLDVEEMARRRYVDSERLVGFFEQIEPLLYRYPAIDPPTFRAAVLSFAAR
jgi:hypothetical protein